MTESDARHWLSDNPPFSGNKPWRSVSTYMNKTFLNACENVIGDTAKPCMACQKLLFCCPRSLDTLSCTHSPALAAAECRGLVSEVGSVSAQGWKGKHTATETRWRAEKVTHLVGTVGLMWGPLAVLLSLYNPASQSPPPTSHPTLDVPPNLSLPFLQGGCVPSTGSAQLRASPSSISLSNTQTQKGKLLLAAYLTLNQLAIPWLIFRNLVVNVHVDAAAWLRAF